MSAAYRDDDDILRGKIRKLRRQYLQEIFELPPIFFQIYRRRVGRIWAGLAGIAGFAGLALSVLYSVLWLQKSPPECNFPVWLLGATLSPLVAYSISQLFVDRLLVHRLLSHYHYAGDSRLLLARLESTSVQQEAQEATRQLERRSVSFLLIALSLLAPLTIHMAGSFLLLGGKDWSETFSIWITASLIIVGHCHLLLAWLSWRYSKRVSEASIEEFALINGAGWRALGLVTLSSFVPAIFAGPFFFLLMIVVGMTGLLFIPAMFGWARNALAFERAEIELSLDLKNCTRR